MVDVYILKVPYEHRTIHFRLLSWERKTEAWSGKWPTEITRYDRSATTVQRRLWQCSATSRAPSTLAHISEMVSSVTRGTSKRVPMDQCASIHTNGETSKYPPVTGRRQRHPALAERPAGADSPGRKTAATECWERVNLGGKYLQTSQHWQH